MSETRPIPSRIAVKFFAEPTRDAELALDPFIGLFHRFIQEEAVLGLLVDVADYAHVPQGPGVILIGHDVDYAIDSTAGRPGLLTTRKHYAHEAFDLGALLRDTLAKALVAIRAIEADGSAAVKFDTSRLEVQILDRLAVSDEAVQAAISQQLDQVLGEVFEKIEIAVASTDRRRPATWSVASRQATDAVTLCGRLGVEMPAAGRAKAFEIDTGALKQLREDGSDFVLIDVREPDEYEICNLGGELIPLGTLSQYVPELDKSAHVVVHCKTGGRGAKATAALRDAGFLNAWNLKGGILAWIDDVDPSLTRY